MGDVANIRVGAAGIAYFGAAGTPLPTAADDDFSALTDLGEISFDGFVEGHDQQSTNIKNMAGQTVRTLTTEQTDSIKLTLLETNDDVLEVYHGAAPDTGVVHVKKQPGARGVWAFLITDGDEVFLITMEDGQVTATENIEYKSDGAVQYPITVTGYPATDDDTMLKYPPVPVS